MIMECTDCKFCGNFESGYRIVCLHPDFKATEINKYFPVGDRNAENCDKFDDDTYEQFESSDFDEAIKWCETKYGEDFTYDNVREWCELQIKEDHAKNNH
jgi:hypothetical protein